MCLRRTGLVAQNAFVRGSVVSGTMLRENAITTRGMVTSFSWRHGDRCVRPVRCKAKLEQSRPASPISPDDGEVEANGGEDDPDVPMDSVDSYGQPAERGVKSIGIPDFIISKATGSLDEDCILLVVEVKKPQFSKHKAIFQVQRHLAMATERRSVQPLRGILIRGRIATIVECG